jgi:hypothetical protein
MSNSNIFWNPRTLESKSSTVEDEKWLLTYKDSVMMDCNLIIKTGTREYSLEARSKAWNSEHAVKRKYG